jgi:hypothetical protein
VVKDGGVKLFQRPAGRNNPVADLIPVVYLTHEDVTPPFLHAKYAWLRLFNAELEKSGQWVC